MNSVPYWMRGAKENRVVDIFLKAAIGASGAATLDTANSKGITSITRDGSVAGKYKVVFAETAVKLLDVTKVVDVSGVSGPPAVSASPQLVILDDQTADSTKKYLVVQFATASTATDLDSGTVLRMHFVFGDSTAQ